MSLARTVAWNTAVQVGGRVLGLAISMAFTALLTRHLGLAVYGQMVAAATYVALFTILGDAGIYLVAVRRAAQERERRSEILGNALGLRLLLPILPLVLAYFLVQFVPSARFPTYAPALKLAVAILAVNGYFTLLNQYLIAIFRLHLRMDLAVLGETVSRLVLLGGTGLVVWLDGGLIAAVLAMTVGSLANLLFAWKVGSRFERFRPRLDLHLAREMLAESALLAVVTMLGLVHFKVDTLLLSLLQPAEDVGIYGVAYKIHEVVITFPGLFVGLLFPVFSRLVRENVEQLQQVFQRAFDVLLLAAVGVSLLVYVCAPAIAWILGAEAAIAPMRILTFALVPVFISLGFTHLLLAEGKQKGLVLLYGFLVAVNIGANYVLIQRYSYLGAASVTLGTESLSLVCLSGYWLGYRRWPLRLRALACVPWAVALGGIVRLFVEPRFGMEAATPGARIGILIGLAAGTFLVYAAGVLSLHILPLETLRALGLPRRDAPLPPATPERAADRSATAPPPPSTPTA